MPDRQTIADVEEKVAGFALLVRGPGLKAEHLVREDARAELHADLTALLASHRKMRKALETADAALRRHACHGGPEMPCIRTEGQCADECGREAGDALLAVISALHGDADAPR